MWSSRANSRRAGRSTSGSPSASAPFGSCLQSASTCEVWHRYLSNRPSGLPASIGRRRRERWSERWSSRTPEVKFLTGGTMPSPRRRDVYDLDMRREGECYAGYRAEERPVRFRIDAHNYEVDEVLDQWYGPEAAWYKV